MNSSQDWMMQLDAKTWREGYDAALYGLDETCNPYDNDEERAAYWWFGFQRGTRELQQNV